MEKLKSLVVKFVYGNIYKILLLMVILDVIPLIIYMITQKAVAMIVFCLVGVAMVLLSNMRECLVCYTKDVIEKNKLYVLLLSNFNVVESMLRSIYIVSLMINLLFSPELLKVYIVISTIVYILAACIIPDMINDVFSKKIIK